jgi:hypothetical protein
VHNVKRVAIEATLMKIIEVLTTSILFLLPGAIAPAYALGQHEQEKQPEEKQQQAKPAQHVQQAKPAQQPQHAAQQAKPAAQQKQAKPVQEPQRATQQKQAKPAQEPQRATQQKQAKPTQEPQRATQQKQAKPTQQSQRAGQQREAKPAQQRAGAQQGNRGQSAGSHGSIPEARFRSNFGRGHTFHVNRGEFANGSGRFQYGGYWFNVVDPWPVGWLYTDDVYVDYLNGGYFLCDPLHPGVYISINIG